MQTHDVIIKPLLTEKSMKESEKGKYAFAVSRFATKTDVKRAVKLYFKAEVASVFISVTNGRTKRVGIRRAEVRLTKVKKAIVTLKPGQVLGGQPEKKDEKKDKKGKK